MATILIKNTKIVDVSGQRFGDIYVEQGKIRAIARKLRVPRVAAIDANGRTLLPAFIDLHAHFREPGFTYKEDIASGSKAAIKGGYTVVSLMANTKPVCDNPEVAQYVRRRAKQIGLVEIFQVGAISRGLLGEDLSDMEGLTPYVWAFSDDGKGVANNALIKRACRKTLELKRTLIEHCQTPDIDDPEEAETTMVMRDIALSRQIGCHLHIAHISAPESVQAVLRAKKQGVHVTCEVTPHHLCLERDIQYTVNPPLPKRETRQFLVANLRENNIDVIATDHAPHSQEDKDKGMPGISGIETAFPLLYSRLVKEGQISLSELTRYMSLNPARTLGLPKGKIQIGYDGDVVLIDEEEPFRITEEGFFSKSANSPLIGSLLWGKVWATIHKGKVVYMDGKIKGENYEKIL